jgi:hypothetical protein
MTPVSSVIDMECVGAYCIRPARPETVALIP